MDMSTSETSDWCGLWTSGDIEESTGSPAPAYGKSQHEWLDGPSNESSGPPRVPASRSRSPAKAAAKMIQGICGPTFFDSSASAGLGSSWANRLAERLAMLGSTELALTWKVKVLPSGRLKPRLVRSTLPTGDREIGGSHWTTPGAKESSSILERPSRAATGRTTEYLGKQMGAAAMMMVWATPTLKGDYNRKGASEQSGDGVATQMRGAQWPTPTVADVEGGRKTRSGARNDEMLLNGLLSGPMPNGSSAPTEKRGVPNPVFACWLMGWPDELTSGALQVIQLFRKSRPKSSKR